MMSLGVPAVSLTGNMALFEQGLYLWLHVFTFPAPSE